MGTALPTTPGRHMAAEIAQAPAVFAAACGADHQREIAAFWRWRALCRCSAIRCGIYMPAPRASAPRFRADVAVADFCGALAGGGQCAVV